MSATLEQLFQASSIVEDAEGALLRQGERPSRVALVLNGAFVGTWVSSDGRIAEGRIAEVKWSAPGIFVGVSTLAGAPIISGIHALSPVTMVVWQSDDFRRITQADLGVTLDILDRCIDGIQHVSHLMQLRTFTTGASRLAAAVLRYEDYCTGDESLVKRWQLSALAGVTPRMGSSILRTWEANKIVRRLGRSGLELLDRAALEIQAAPATGYPAPPPPAPRQLAS